MKSLKSDCSPAAVNGHVGVADVLLTYSADVEAKDQYGRTALMVLYSQHATVSLGFYGHSFVPSLSHSYLVRFQLVLISCSYLLQTIIQLHVTLVISVLEKLLMYKSISFSSTNYLYLCIYYCLSSNKEAINVFQVHMSACRYLNFCVLLKTPGWDILIFGP